MFDFYRLKNGVRVVQVPMEGVQSVAVGVYVGTGSRYETPKINGISHFLEHMVFKGTKKFPTPESTSYLEGLGAIQNAWTDVDATAYWTKIPADKWQQGLELVKELALYPQIPEHDLEIERGVILEEINRREDRPDEMVSEELYKSMFGNNPLGMTVLGEPEVIKTVSKQDFEDYHSQQYTAGNLVVVVAGKISNFKVQITNSIEEWFGVLPMTKSTDFEPVVWQQSAPKFGLRQKDLAAQAHLEIGFEGVKATDPDRFALGVMTAYLGQGLSSRLFIELREKRGLCYAVHASDEKYPDTGVWGVYAGVAVDKFEEAVRAIVAELKTLKTRKIAENEVEKAKEKIRGPMLFSMENPINQMNFFAKQALDRPEEMLTYEQVEERLMEVDAEAIQKVAERVFLLEKLNLAVVGPINKERVQKLLGELKI